VRLYTYTFLKTGSNICQLYVFGGWKKNTENPGLSGGLRYLTIQTHQDERKSMAPLIIAPLPQARPLQKVKFGTPVKARISGLPGKQTSDDTRFGPCTDCRSLDREPKFRIQIPSFFFFLFFRCPARRSRLESDEGKKVHSVCGPPGERGGHHSRMGRDQPPARPALES
jgi:hypothetical protein